MESLQVVGSYEYGVHEREGDDHYIMKKTKF